MNRQRFTALLVAALLAISGALYLSTQRNLPRDPHGMALLPSLAGELNSVSALTVRKGAAAPVTVHKQGEQWTVAERADYPADVAKLKKLLLALSDAKIREEKTSNPDSYAVIGVEDPSQPGAGGTQVELTAQNGKHAVIVGKSAGEGTFIRRAGEKTSYMVEPAISVEAEPRYWIDTRLLDIPTDKIQSVESKPASGAAYSVHRVPANPPKPTDNSSPSTAASARTRRRRTRRQLTRRPPSLRPRRPRTNSCWMACRAGARRRIRKPWRPRPRTSATSRSRMWFLPATLISANPRPLPSRLRMAA